MQINGEIGRRNYAPTDHGGDVVQPTRRRDEVEAVHVRDQEACSG